MTQTIRADAPRGEWSEASEPFASAALRLGAHEFAAEFPGAYLCFLASPLGVSDEEPALPPTKRLLVEREGAAIPSEEALKLYVVPIVKREGANPFPMMITVGRAANNDVQVPAADVSQLHGHFSRDGEGWVITDVGSTNGTFLGGERLKLRAPVPVELGTMIVFGSIETRILEGASLYELLQPRAHESE